MTTLITAKILGYALNVVLCSGMLFIFYRVMLAPRPIYQWNRCYLILLTPLSMIIPLLSFPILPAVQAPLSAALAYPAAASHESGFQEQDIHLAGGISPWPDLPVLIFLLVGVVFLTITISALLRIRMLMRKNSVTQMDGYKLISTREKDAPFTFFRLVFWNEDIDMRSENGQKMLQHELVHVREWHSADKLFTHLLATICWWNPAYWLSRRELSLVHEFSCDGQTLAHQGGAGLSSMLLSMVFPGRSFSITNSFYSSSIKRRLSMLSKSPQLRHPWVFRLFSLLAVTIVLAAFSLEHKPMKINGHAHAPKKFLVVIDAGHGGKDPGAQADDGTLEKDIDLALVKQIAEANSDPNLSIILTRNDDSYPELRGRVDFAAKQKPDAFISIHVDLREASQSGFKCYVSRAKTPHSAFSEALGHSVGSAIEKQYPNIQVPVQVRAEKSIWVLDAPQVTYPAILLTCGNLKNVADMQLMKDPGNQQKMAIQILHGIETFLKAQDASAK